MKRGSSMLIFLSMLLLLLPPASSVWTDNYRDAVTEYTDFITGKVVTSPEDPSTTTTSSQRTSRTLTSIPSTLLVRRPSIEQIIPTIPTSSLRSCQITGLFWSKPLAVVGDTVELIITSQNCLGTLRVHLFERDFLVDDDIVLIEKTLTGDKTSLSWKITNDILTLFNEVLEEQQLEIYFQIESVDSVDSSTPLRSPLLLVTRPSSRAGQRITPAPEPGAGGNDGGDSGFISTGCNNYQFIDKDCDGFVIGGKNAYVGIMYDLIFPPIPELGADADDNDPTLNTPASVIARYGDFTNINNFKTYLYDLGYTHTINNVYFVALNGDDLTAQVNNINRPWRYRPVPTYSSSVIVPGDVVVYRGGIYDEKLGTAGSAYPNFYALQGTSSQPIILITYPGERVIFSSFDSPVQPGTTSYPALGIDRNTQYVIIDGFELDGMGRPNLAPMREVINLGPDFHHVTFRNLDIRNGARWGVFGVLGTNRDYVTFDNVVIHNIAGEHCLYRNDQSSTGTTPAELDTDIGWVIKNSLFYKCSSHAIHWRGGDQFTFENNILHTTGLNGIEMKDSPTNGIIRNNLIFNNGHSPINIFEDNDAQRHGASGTNNIQITNNILVTRSGQNGVSTDDSTFSAIRFTHSTVPPRPHRDVQIRNNIIYTVGSTPFQFEYAPDVPLTTIENNIIYRVGASPPNDRAGMSACGWTDNTHDLIDGTCPDRTDKYVWHYARMLDPPNLPLVNRPLFRTNAFANPLFIDVNNIYTTLFTPRFYNFLPLHNSPNIGFALPQYATPADIRGIPRDGSPDAGAYEYDSLGSSSPYLLGVDPSYVSVGAMGGWGLTFRGYNFDSLAELEVCALGNVCDSIPNSALYGITSNKIMYDFVTYGIPTGTYTFRVVNPGNVYSANRVGLGVQSIPDRPTNLIATSISPTSVSLSWQDNSNNENGFSIERSLLPASEFTQIGRSFALNYNTFIDTTVSPGTTGVTYYYRVRAFNYATNSEYSNVLQVFVPPPGAFDFGISVSPNFGSVLPSNSVQTTVTATYVSGTSGAVIFSASNLPSGVTASFTPASCTPVSGASCSTTMTLSASGSAASVTNQQVSIIGTSGTTVRNTFYSLTVTASLLNPPTGLTVTTPAAPAGQTQLLLNWQDNSNNENSFEIQRRQEATAPSWTWATIANVPGSSSATGTFTDTLLSSGTYYEYKMRAVNAAGTSAWHPASAPYPFGMTRYTLPNAPITVAATAQSTSSVLITWTDNSNNEAGFWIGRRIGSTGNFIGVSGATNLASSTGTGTARQFTDTNGGAGLSANTNYQYMVSSFNPAGSGNSVPASVTTFTCNPSTQQSCSNNNGVCAGTLSTCNSQGQWGACDYSARPGYAAVETGAVLCNDNLDNDCDIEFDYDGAGSVKGDSGCPISITGINAPLQVFTSSNFNLQCTSSVANVRSIVADLDGNSCPYIENSWNGNTVLFRCTSSSTLGTQTARCDVDASYSYPSGSARTSPVEVVPNTCAGYGSPNSCESALGGACDWCLGCSGSQTSGGANRCVQTGTCTYLCTQGQCGASCSGGGCTQTQTCNTNTCGCIEQPPILATLSSTSINLAVTQPITITGQYFAANAEVRVDGAAINPTRITSRSATQIIFQYQPRDFGVGQHQVSVYNPTSQRTSLSLPLTITATPRITSLNPSVLINNQATNLGIIGQEFDPVALVVAGQLYQGAWTSPTHELIQIPNIPAGVPPGDYSLVVINRDLTVSNTMIVAVRQPFSFTLHIQPSTATVLPNTQLPATVTVTAIPFSTPELVTVTVTPPTGITATFPQGTSCTPNPTCQVSLSLAIGNVATSQQYIVNIQATSPSTQRLGGITLTAVQGQISDCRNGIQNAHETCSNPDGGGPICSTAPAPGPYLCNYEQSCLLDRDCVVNQQCGTGLCWRDNTCQRDSDCDRVPDIIDRCLTTPASVVVSLRNGCPLPRVTRFSPSLTTDFTQVEDLEHVQDLSLGIVGVGRIQYLNREVSVLRIVNTVHQALNLDAAITMQPNLIGLDSTLYSELNHPTTLTFSGLTSTTAPTPLRDGLICSTAICEDLSYANGAYTVTVSGFSDYSTQPGACGDTYCNLDETCSSCSSDCGVCGGPGSGGGGGGGGGGDRASSPTVNLDTNVQQTVTVLRNSRISVIYQGKEYGVRVPRATADDVIVIAAGISYGIPLGQRLGIDLDSKGSSDANVEYESLQGNLVTLTFSRILRSTLPTFQESSSTPKGPLTPSFEETPQSQEPELDKSLLSKAWVRIPLVLFALVLAFYFRFVHLRRLE